MPKFIINTNGVYKRYHSFMMNITDEIFEIQTLYRNFGKYWRNK